MALMTATGDFNYGDLYCYHGFTYKLSELVDLVHKELCRELHWKSNQLKPGTFGYDSIACSIGFLLKNIPTGIEEGAETVHNAWIRNYLFWTIIKPHELLPQYYTQSSKPIIDKRRRMLSTTSYSNLPEIEKDTNRIIVVTVLEFLGVNFTNPINEDTFLD